MKVVRDLGPNSVTLIVNSSVHSSVNSSVHSSLWRDKRAQGTAKVDTSMNAIGICRHPKCARFCTAFFYRLWRLPDSLSNNTAPSSHVLPTACHLLWH